VKFTPELLGILDLSSNGMRVNKQNGQIEKLSKLLVFKKFIDKGVSDIYE
jgi:hypothetical protein